MTQFENQKPHSQASIDKLMAVASGMAIGHVFKADDTPSVLISREAHEVFSEIDIMNTQDMFSALSGEPFVYVGTLDGTEALQKAMKMRADNCNAKSE